jgi:RND family efflux transporter MFP subunit
MISKFKAPVHLLLFMVLLLFVSVSFAEDAKKAAPKKGMPPALVKLGELKTGTAEPMSELVGTVFYTHVSDLAAEVSGKVSMTNYEEGQQVKQGHILVRLNTDLIEMSIAGLKASYDQAALELERARKDLDRMEALYREDSISASMFDDHQFKVRGLQKKLAALDAQLKSLKLQKNKMSIPSPFNGLVLKKTVDAGEWVSVGGTVAVVAESGVVDVVLDVPSKMLSYLSKGREVSIQSGGQKLKATFVGYIPKGDVATRTFSVKLRMKNTASLIEGMEATAILPTGAKSKGTLIHRDAVISKYGRTVVFASIDGTAKMFPVQVVGYDGMLASISGPGLEAGMQIVLKGNERIRDGQPLKSTGGK